LPVEFHISFCIFMCVWVREITWSEETYSSS